MDNVVSSGLHYGLRSSIKCMFDVRPNIRPVLIWMLDRLDSDIDRIYLSKTRAIDNTESETPAAQRMLNTFCDQAAANNFITIRRPLKSDPLSSLEKVIIEIE